VVGLGAIGVKVANHALRLGMHVIGYDPELTVQSAWKLSSSVQQAVSIDDMLGKVDFVTFHVPLNDATRHMINAARVQRMKNGAVILNFARDGIVDDEAVCAAIKEGRIHAYVCDFTNNLLKNHERVITLPHLGASTVEAEDNCAIMIADQLRAYLEHGNIRNSVNFPDVEIPRNEGHRIAIANSNVPNMVGQISTVLAKADLNIIDMLNKSRGDLAYTLVDVDHALSNDIVGAIKKIDGVLNVRLL